ncbi:hypothetical protein SVAN01_02817 [Stagonosporopsis vannaccii]|nr:hypothetical protein SVAN01_02817 [Stagonosporopsis vannaccii]
MTVPSVGDILMLSQVAWRTGRAFIAGRKDAPPDFQVVETDISSVAQALKQLAETLHADANPTLISRSDQETQDGVAIILSSCQRTIHDLDSLIDRYQVIRKHRTPGGFAIERSWSDLVLAQYESIIWTTEGGSLHDLSSLLQMHTKSIRLLAEAVQRQVQVQHGSLSQLERMVTPMAKRFDSMYDLPGSLEDQLEEVSRFVQELTLVDPVSKATPTPQRNLARSPATEISDQLSTTSIPVSPPESSQRRMNTQVKSPHVKSPSVSALSSASAPTDKDASPTFPSDPTVRTPTAPRKHVSELSYGGTSIRDSTSSCASSTSSARSRASSNSRHALISVSKSIPLPWTPELAESIRPCSSSFTLLPPPAMRPSSAQSAPDISGGKSNSTLSPFPAPQDSIAELHRSSTTASQKAAFEKEAFRNSAILCDVRGTLVEYSQQSQPDPDNPSDMADIEMVPACTTCRIAVVRKRITTPSTPHVRVATSIWALSTDNDVRLEIPLSPSSVHIPYSSYFSPVKVSLTTPSTLRFHSLAYGTRLLRSTHSSWVNFLFDTPQAATLFQNEIMGRVLLATFRTTKTMRIHEGALAGFAYAEQMCALENLRVWEDETGAVVASLHFSASFREGWLAFYLNSKVEPIKVTDSGVREVKVRGLRVPVERAGWAITRRGVGVDDGEAFAGSADVDSASAAAGATARRPKTAASTKKASEKKGRKAAFDRKKIISGARIEFATEAEKSEFLELAREYQKPERLCDNVPLMGDGNGDGG